MTQPQSNNQKKFKLGLIVNPIAGVGGSVALKGSDGVVEQALSLGAQLKSNERAQQALSVLKPYVENLTIYTADGDMGEDSSKLLGFETNVVYHRLQAQSCAQDSENAAQVLKDQGVDLLLFAGGDGTARNICHQLGDELPVLGVPAGCKIHSGVYAVTPKAAGRVVEMMVNNELVSLHDADVMDIDESLFRDGVVKAKRYGEMLVPTELTYVQATKSGGKELDDLVLDDIAACVIDNMEDELFVIGSGSTTAHLMENLGLENTLLGVDLVSDHQLIASDVTEALLFEQISRAQAQGQPIKLVITLIGGQGHIFGRGNQQLSPRVIRAIGKDNILIVATKSKLKALDNRPLIIDTSDDALNTELSGFFTVITGYNDQVLYPAASPA